MFLIARIFTGSASMPRLLTMNPRSFPDETPKTDEGEVVACTATTVLQSFQWDMLACLL